MVADMQLAPNLRIVFHTNTDPVLVDMFREAMERAKEHIGRREPITKE